MRDYFGEKIGFYFAWLEHYSTSLLVLTVVAVSLYIPMALVQYGTCPNDCSHSVVWTPLYSLILVVWCSLHSEGWKRRNAELMYLWDSRHFAFQPPRPHFVSSYYQGVWRGAGATARGLRLKTWRGKYVMQRQPGFYAEDGRFIHDEAADCLLTMDTATRRWVQLGSAPVLLMVAVATVIGALSILQFRMLANISRQAEPYRIWGGQLGAVVRNAALTPTPAANASASIRMLCCAVGRQQWGVSNSCALGSHRNLEPVG